MKLVLLFESLALFVVSQVVFTIAFFRPWEERATWFAASASLMATSISCELSGRASDE